MDQSKIIDELSRNREVFRSLLTDTQPDEFSWKPRPDKWCLLEVVCHLYDEEREDFKARVKHCLENPEDELASIDPVGWVTARKYLEQNFEEKLDTFLSERGTSIKWLESFENPQWQNAIDHPKLGKMSAKQFLSNWLAHDFIHIRQIIKIRYAYLDEYGSDSLKYAGNW